ncbi:serine hydrolase domain-containing protein [Micromonospora sp.]|uniref:serine hydrolase domain-containing protein n=1 Tax=Micromonospora sp. TaxID=1876 RepID=UPI003B3ACF39
MDLAQPDQRTLLAAAVTCSRTAYSRRQVLRLGGAAGALGLLAACGGGSGSTGSTTSGASSPAASPAASSASSAVASSAAIGPVSLDDVTRASLDKIGGSVFTSSGLTGMAAAVWIGDDVWQTTYGVSDLDSKAPYRAEDYVRIASITKSFTATAVLQMVDAGSLALDDVLESYVPGIANGSQITIQQLLGMQSGIYDFTSNAQFLADFDADPTMAWSEEQTVALIKANQPSFAPGAQLQYCDSNYVLLGMILEKTGGKSAGEVITEQVVKKVGLTGTSYPTDATMPDPHPTAYRPGGDTSDGSKPFDNAANPPKVVNEVNPAVASTAGAMISTLADLKVWGAELAGGSLLKPETQALRLQYTRFPNVPVNLGYGLGCERLNDFTGHNGAILGYSTVVMRDPNADVTIAAVANESTNFSTPTSNFAYGVIKTLYPSQWT